MENKLAQIKALVAKDGTEKMKELVLVLEHYILGINHIFRQRDVTEMVLMEFDFPLFIRQLEAKGVFENKCNLEIKVLVLNTYDLARHLWEFVDEQGNLKTGDDLHKAWPLFFADKEMNTVEEMYQGLRYM